MDIQDVEDTEEVDRTSQREQGQGKSRQGRTEKAPARRALVVECGPVLVDPLLVLADLTKR